MNVLWVLIALGVLYGVLRLWEDEDEDEDEEAAEAPRAVSGRETPSGGIKGAWRLMASGIARVVLLVAALALAVVIEFGPWLAVDALSGDDPGHASPACLARVAGTATGPGPEAARALVKAAPDLLCSDDAAAELARMRPDSGVPR